MKLMFVFVGMFEGILIVILCGVLVFFGSRSLIRKFAKSQTAKRINTLAFLASIFLNPALILMVIGLIMYYSPRNQELIKMRMEYENQILDDKDRQFSEASIIGKTKEEIIAQFGRAETTDTTMIYDYTTFTTSFIVEIELENDIAVRINIKRK